jgi:hypothetical protein
MHYAGGFSPKRKMRFLFWLFSDQRLGCALNLSSGALEKSVGLIRGIHRSFSVSFRKRRSRYPDPGLRASSYPLGSGVFAAAPLRPE